MCIRDSLQTLVEHGILRRDRYQERPPRHEYRLTPKGLELYPVLVALLQWGDRHLAGEDGPPTAIVHRICGHHAEATVVCTGCGEALAARDTRAVRAEAAPV
jgi:hypothetical protein